MERDASADCLGNLFSKSKKKSFLLGNNFINECIRNNLQVDFHRQLNRLFGILKLYSSRRIDTF